MSSLNITGGGNSPLMINGTNIFELIYPVGSVYLTMNSTSPADLFGGTWEQLAEGYTLWTASSDAGETIEAGLPNITGTFQRGADGEITAFATNYTYEAPNAFYQSGTYLSSAKGYGNSSGSYAGYNQLGLDASRSSSIYGNSDTVQPPAIKVYAWRRTN